MKILTDFAVSTIAYFFIGYGIAYGTSFFVGAEVLAEKNGFELTKFFFLLTFAAAIPAIISGGIAERARFNPQLAATFLIVGFVYPFFEGIAWNQALASRLGSRPALARNSTISPVRSSCMRWAAGLRCRRCCFSARVTDGIAKSGEISRTRRHRFPSSRSAPGSSP